MSTERACRTCAHWLRPEQRTDYRSAITSDYSDINIADDEAFNRRESEHDALDRTFGECRGVPANASARQLPSPAATVRDGSYYFAQLYTVADFFCALWTPVDLGGTP